MVYIFADEEEVVWYAPEDRQKLISSRFASPMYANISNTLIHNPSARGDLSGILSRSRRKDLLVLRSMEMRKSAQDNAKEGWV